MRIELSCRVVSSSYVHVAKLLLPVVATTTLALHSFLYRPPAHSWNRIKVKRRRHRAYSSPIHKHAYSLSPQHIISLFAEEGAVMALKTTSMCPQPTNTSARARFHHSVGVPLANRASRGSRFRFLRLAHSSRILVTTVTIGNTTTTHGGGGFHGRSRRQRR